MERLTSVISTDTSTYTDVQGLARIKELGRHDEGAALEEVARQFEAIFIQMMLGTMREASLGDDLFDSEQAGLYRDMFDKQISLTLTSGRGIGLAEQMIAQLRRAGTQVEPVDNHGKDLEDAPAQIIPVSPAIPATEPSALLPVNPSTSTRYETPEAFVQDVWPHARRAAEELGVDPKILVAQAALETGWGKHIPSNLEGQSSFNIFGIKAGRVWPGSTVEARTQEFNGESFQTEHSRFRAYNSIADSFSDYVNMIQTNPRFKAAQGAGSQFINFLQQGGYATDPDYAGKINRIVNSDVMQGMVADFKA